MAFSKSSRSSFDSQHFNATNVAFREIRAAWFSNFLAQFRVSQYSILSLHILSIYSIYIGWQNKTIIDIEDFESMLAQDSYKIWKPYFINLY
jgi:hypothetical protein